MRFEEIKELIHLCHEKKIAELEVELKGVKVRILGSHQPPSIEYLPAPTAMPMMAAPQVLQAAPAPLSLPAPAGGTSDAVPARAAHLKDILSPMVGTLYRAPSPDAPPFAEVGTRVTPESVVCIIEAMKLMNEIKAEVSGRIVRVLVENGQPVEYNQPLFEVEP